MTERGGSLKSVAALMDPKHTVHATRTQSTHHQRETNAEQARRGHTPGDQMELLDFTFVFQNNFNSDK